MGRDCRPQPHARQVRPASTRPTRRGHRRVVCDAAAAAAIPSTPRREDGRADARGGVRARDCRGEGGVQLRDGGASLRDRGTRGWRRTLHVGDPKGCGRMRLLPTAWSPGADDGERPSDCDCHEHLINAPSIGEFTFAPPSEGRRACASARRATGDHAVR